MIIYNTEVELKEGQTLFVVPWGDVQSIEEYPRLIKLVEWLVARKKEGHKVKLLGMGDYFESPSPSDRAGLNSAKRGFGFYDDLSKVIDEAYGKRAEEMAKILFPLEEDILGLLEGHHSHVFSGLHGEYSSRVSTDQYLADLLLTQFFGAVVAVTLTINGLPFRIFASHGYGSARTPGARVTKRVRMRDVYGHANWYVMGHDDEKCVYVLEALEPDGTYKKQYFTGSGSFQRSYQVGSKSGTYVERLLLPPAAMGVVICSISVDFSGSKQRLDYHISS